MHLVPPNMFLRRPLFGGVAQQNFIYSFLELDLQRIMTHSTIWGDFLNSNYRGQEHLRLTNVIAGQKIWHRYHSVDHHRPNHHLQWCTSTPTRTSRTRYPQTHTTVDQPPPALGAKKGWGVQQWPVVIVFDPPNNRLPTEAVLASATLCQVLCRWSMLRSTPRRASTAFKEVWRVKNEKCKNVKNKKEMPLAASNDSSLWIKLAASREAGSPHLRSNESTLHCQLAFVGEGNDENKYFPDSFPAIQFV